MFIYSLDINDFYQFHSHYDNPMGKKLEWILKYVADCVMKTSRWPVCPVSLRTTGVVLWLLEFGVSRPESAMQIKYIKLKRDLLAIYALDSCSLKETFSNSHNSRRRTQKITPKEIIYFVHAHDKLLSVELYQLCVLGCWAEVRLGWVGRMAHNKPLNSGIQGSVKKQEYQQWRRRRRRKAPMNSQSVVRINPASQAKEKVTKLIKFPKMVSVSVWGARTFA